MAVLCFLSVLPGAQVNAATVDLDIEVSSTEVEVGDWFTVTLRFRSSEALAGVYARITYNSNVLEYTNGDAEGDTGSLILSKMENEPAMMLEYTLYFTAKAEGNVSIAVEESGMYNAAAELLGSPTASRNVQINASGSDATLKSLKASYGVLQPAFSPDVTQYTLDVPNEITSVTLTAVANDSLAMVQTGGTADLAEGVNERKITVISPSGTVLIYTVKINRAASENSSKEESSGQENSKDESSKEESSGSYGIVSFKVDGMTLYMQSAPEGGKIPSGFTRSTYEYKGEKYDIAATSDGNIQLFYLTDFKGENGAFYLYDEGVDICLNVALVYIDHNMNLVMDAELGGFEPYGCSLQAATIEGRKVRVYVAEGTEVSKASEYIVFSMDASGNRDYYVYNLQKGTLTEYIEEIPGEDSSTVEESSAPEQPPVTGDSSQPSDPGNGDGFSLAALLASGIKLLPYIMMGLVALIFLLLIIIVLMIRSYCRRRRMTNDDELHYDNSAVVEAPETPEDPEDIQLDSGAFVQWKEATQRVPVVKMTQVHTATIGEITSMIAKQESETQALRAAQLKSQRPVQEKKPEVKPTVAPVSELVPDQKKTVEKDKPLSADEFFL